MSGTGGLTINGPGTAVSFTLGGTNTFSGYTTLASTGITLLKNASSQSILNLQADGTTYDLDGADQTIGGLTGSSASHVFLGAQKLTVNTNTSDLTFEGVMTDGTRGSGGKFVKAGSKAFTFATSPTYTGSTTISGGTLQVGKSTSPGTLPSTDLYVNGGTLKMGVSQNFATLSGTGGTIDLGTSTTAPLTLGILGNSPTSGFAGTIKGTGTLIIGPSEPASLTLTGNNTFTGGIIINAGSSLISTTSSLPTPQESVGGSGGVTNSGTLTFKQSQDGTFAGAIIGGGSVAIEGGKAATFTGNNTYTGGTTITNDGSSLTGSTSTLPPGGPIVVGAYSSSADFPSPNAVLTFNQGSDNPNAFTGSLSGAGSVTVQDKNLTFTGVSTYLGTTTIAEGASLTGTIITNSQGASMGSLPAGGTFSDAGALTFSATSNGTFSGQVTGDGTLNVNGTVTFSPNSNISSSIHLNNNGNMTGSADNFSGNINLTNTAALTFDQSVSGTYKKSISGTGSVIKNGTRDAFFDGRQFLYWPHECGARDFRIVWISCKQYCKYF